MKRSILEVVIDILKMVFLGILIAFLITRTLSPVRVIGTSMDPTYENEQMLVVNRVVYKIHEPEYGDVAMFKPMDDLKDRYVKRIIGLPGDVVEIKENKVYRNDLLIEEEYIKEPMVSEDFEKYLLKDDEYFVLGDNRNNSRDSRYFGPVKMEHIVGRIAKGE